MSIKKIIIMFSLLTLSYASFSEDEVARFDEFRRLVYYPNKQEVPCPVQDEKTSVLLAMGQSNSANHLEKRITTRYPGKVFNYFKGKCYVAGSPLLGASGEDGEFITLIADRLIENNDYERVLILSTGIGGTQMARWREGGDINDSLQPILEELHSNSYHVTEMIFHQGETDWVLHTDTEEYKQGFYSLVASLRKYDSRAPAMYFAIATRCGQSDINPNWHINNNLAQTQRSFEDASNNIYLGADTDSIVLFGDRYDTCHFGIAGQEKTSKAFAQAIHNNKINYTG